MKTNQQMRQAIDHSLDALEMIAFNQGFEACLNGIDEIANAKHNQGYTTSAEILRELVKELTGENITTNH